MIIYLSLGDDTLFQKYAQNTVRIDQYQMNIHCHYVYKLIVYKYVVIFFGSRIGNKKKYLCFELSSSSLLSILITTKQKRRKTGSLFNLLLF